jgi:hypothetical protein
MSLTRVVIATIALLTPIAPASATIMQRPERPVVAPKNAPRLKAEDVAKRAAEDAAKKEAQDAAKKEADELLARDQALAAAKQKPTPAQLKVQAKIATQESRLRDARNAAIRAKEAAAKAKEDAIAAQQKAIADQEKARQAKLAAEQAQREQVEKAIKARAEARTTKSFALKVPAKAEPVLPRILGRMPMPEDVPYVRPVAATTEP